MIEVPDVEESSATGTAEIADGTAGLVVWGETGAGGKVRLLLLQPRIYVEEEKALAPKT